MSRRDEAAPYLGALATLLAAATLLPVVTGTGWAWQAVFLVAVVVASGMGLRSLTRSPALVVVGQSAVGILGLTAVFARSHAVLGFLPGPDAIATMARLAQSGQQATRQFATPAPAVPGISFLLVLGVVAVAVAVDALAVTFGMAVAAGLPLLVLYCVPAAVLPHGASALSFAMVAAGWLILLGHDGRLRVNDWGRVLRKGPESGRRRFGDDDLEVVGASARRLGIATVIAAIIVPMLMPSLANGLIDPTHNGSGTGGQGGLGATSIDPTLTLRQNLTARSTNPVLTYRTTQATPSPLRLVTDDEFNGETWESSDGRPSSSQGLSSTLPPPEGLTAGVSATTQHMQVKVTTLTEAYLPVPYPATKVNVKGSWVYAANSLDIVARGDTTKGLSYTVDYLDVQPTVSQLEAAPAPSQDLLDAYTRLPDFLPSSILRTAKQVTAKASTEYDKAVALQEWFRSDGGFTYDTDVVSPRNVDAVSAFLTSKHGYCVQFSSAMAVMARLLGIPARIGVGFLPGTKLSDGRNSISLNDAHAWPELYFEGIGWVRFEPTPQVRSGAAPAYSEPAAAAAPAPAPSASATASSGHDAKNLGLQGKNGSPVSSSQGTSSGGTGVVGRIPLRWWVVIAALLVAAFVTPVAAVLARRRRRRRARDAVARAEAVWGELLDRVADLGLQLPSGATPRQTEQRVVAEASLGPPARAALSRVVRHLEQARYAARPAYAQDGPDPEEDLATVVRAVRAACDRKQRLRARVLPRSGTDALLQLSAAAGERMSRLDRRMARAGSPATRAPSARRRARDRRHVFGRRSH